MGLSERTASGTILQRVMEVLMQFPEGLAVKDLIHQLDPPPSQDVRAFYEQVMSSCIPPLKAGWLNSRGYYLSVSEKGKLAYEQFKDPHSLIKEAARHSTRGWLSLHFPRPYYITGKAKDRVVAEIRAVRRIGVKRLAAQALGTTPGWQKILPIQAVRRFAVSELNAGSEQSFLDSFNENDSNHFQGGHAIYVRPQVFQNSVLRDLATQYPPAAGIKIIKTPGTADQAKYVNIVNKGDSKLHLNSVYGHKHLTLVANLLNTLGVGPRLFDLIEIQAGETVWTAYVLEDVDGGTPSEDQCKKGVQQLRQLEERGLLHVGTPEGFDDVEFKCPDCEGNALITRDGVFKYVDFQNFLLGDYASYLRQTAVEATEASHFGDRSILRGGSYLYQAVPGVNLPAKRNIEDRVQVLEPLLQKAGVSIKDKLTLDVGCNIGMMMGQYLKMGARWTHGWDRPGIVPHTEKLLLGLGCTRFSTTGADITESYDLTEAIPSFLKPALHGCVVSYLAVRGHIGWLPSLTRIPWSFLIYEGHEGETQEDFDRYMKDLRQAISFDVAAIGEYIDGDSDSRTIAILRRREDSEIPSQS